jgi:hypothetical protein
MPLSLTTDRSSKPVEDTEGCPRQVRFLCSTEAESEAVGAREFRKGQQAAQKPPKTSPRKHGRYDGDSLYVAAARGGCFKIGFSCNTQRRLAELRCQTKLPLRLLLAVPIRAGNSRWVERRVHERFAAERVDGEWFSPSPRLRAFIRECRALGGLPEDIDPPRKTASHEHRPWLVQRVGDRLIGICRDCNEFVAREVTP